MSLSAGMRLARRTRGACLRELSVLRERNPVVVAFVLAYSLAQFTNGSNLADDLLRA